MRLLVDERGASSVEYAVMVAGISAVIVGTVMALGLAVDDSFSVPALIDALTL